MDNRLRQQLAADGADLAQVTSAITARLIPPYRIHGFVK
jgi:hypothetical protein